MKLNEIQKAQEKISSFKRLGIELKKSAPHLNRMEKAINLCESYLKSDDRSKDDFLNFITPTIDYVNSMTLENFSLTAATGGTATLVTSIVDASLSNTNNTYSSYIQEFSVFMPQQLEIEYIIKKSHSIDPELQNQFKALIDFYNVWLNKIKSDSDYAKDMRNFMEHLKGYLDNRSGLLSFSWDKMIDSIGISDPKMKVLFKKQQKVYEILYEALSQKLKENVTKIRPPVQDLHNDLISMTYAIMTCIDLKKLK